MDSRELPPHPHFKYPMKMKQFGLSETKLFHFHGAFKKNEINQQSEPHTFIHIIPYPEILDPPLVCYKGFKNTTDATYGYIRDTDQQL